MYQDTCIACGKISLEICRPDEPGFSLHPVWGDGCSCHPSIDVSRPRAYLAGPITGTPDYAAWFAARAAAWRAAGWHVTNPAEIQPGLESDPSIPWSYYMRRDLPHLLAATAILLRPNFATSRGANLELLIAAALGMKIYDADAVPSLDPDPLFLTGRWVAEPDRYRLVRGDPTSAVMECISFAGVPVPRQADAFYD